MPEPEIDSPNWSEYPETITLHFRTKEAKSEFMGGLSDGFGENISSLDWDWAKYDSEALETGEPFNEQPRFAVDMFDYLEA